MSTLSGPGSGREDAARTSRRRSLLRDLVGTSVAQGCSVVLNAASLAVISRRLGESDLGFYALERRGMAMLQPLVLVGLTVAMPRYIAGALGAHRDDHREYAVAGLALVAAIALSAAALMLAFPRAVAAIAFGSADAVGLGRALAGFVAVTAAFQALHAIFRGYLRVRRANLLELVVVGGLPLGLALAGPTDLVAFMWALNGGILVAAVAAIPADPSLWREAVTRLACGLRGRSRELLRYGLARTPGDIAVVALFSIAPIAVVQTATSVEAGYTSVVQSTLNLISVMAVPISVLLLPRVALDHEARLASRASYRLLAQASVDIGLGAGALLVLASPLLVELWLPAAPGYVVTAQAVASLGVPGYVTYLVLRSYLDAVAVRPLSSRATLAGLAILVALLPAALALGIGPPAVVASAVLALALGVTGAVTLWQVRAWLPGLASWTSEGPVVLASGVVAGLGLLLARADLGCVAAATAAATFGFVAVLVALRRPWLLELRRRLPARPAGTAR